MSPYLAGGMLIAFVAWSAGMFGLGYEYESHKAGEASAQRDLAQAGVTIDAQQGVIGAQQAQSKTSNEVSNAYQGRISSIDDQYRATLAGVWATPAAASNGMPAVAAGAGRCDAAAGAAGLSRKLKAALIALMHQADVQTARLQACQQWIRAQGEGGVSK